MLFEALATVVDVLDRTGIPQMVSGSVASARHGEARATQDIDLVIDPSPEQVGPLREQQRATIDWDYLREWAARLSVGPLLDEVLRSDSLEP